MKPIFYCIGLFSLLCIPGYGEEPQAQTIQPDLGIPLGGIGTGKIEILPDGSFGQITIQNNPSRPLNAPEGCFSAIHITQNKNSITKILRKNNEKGVGEVLFGESYPISEVEYKETAMPVTIRLKAFSPLTPQDINESCLPVTIYQYTVKNTSQEDITVSLAMSWSNLIGLGGTPDKTFSPEGEIIHEKIEQNRLKGILCRFSSQTNDPYQQNALGETALAAEEQTGDDLSSLLLWHPQQKENEFWKSFGQNGKVTISADNSKKESCNSEARPAAALSITRKLAPQKETVFVFYYLWYFPHFTGSDGKDIGMYYANQWKSVREGLDWTAKNWVKAQERANSWKKILSDSSSPDWLNQRLLSSLKAVSPSTIALKDGRFSFLTGDSQFPGNIGSPEELLALSSFLIQWYPELFASQLNLYINSQSANGEVPSAAGNIYAGIGTGDVKGGFLSRPDSTSAFVLLLYANYLRTGDNQFWEQMFPHIRAGVTWLMDKDTNNDGIPEGPAYHPYGGSQSTALFSADLYLAALRVGEEAGQRFKDSELQARSHATWISAEKNVVYELWNSTCLQAIYHPDNPTSADAGKLVAGTMPGEWFTSQYGWKSSLGYSYPFKTMQAVANRIYQEDTENLFSNIPLFITSFTPSLLARYGLYEAAGQFIRKYPSSQTNPADARLSQLGLWSYFQALSGFTMDQARGCLTVGPLDVKNAASYTYPLITGSFNGILKYSRSPYNGQEHCDIRFTSIKPRGEIRLKEIAFKLPQDSNPDSYILRVIYNNKYLVGQDFSRENTKVFGLNSEKEFRAGDEITLLLASKDSGRIVIDLEKSKPVLLGTKCAITNFSSIKGGFRFNLENLLSEKQLVFFEMRNSGEKNFTLSLNGEKLQNSFSKTEPLPMLIGTSEISADDLEWIRIAEEGCTATTIHIGTMPVKNELKKRLWDFQEAIRDFKKADGQQRGFQIEVLESAAPDKKPKETRDFTGNELTKSTKDAKSNTRKKTRETKTLPERPEPVDTPNSIETKGLPERTDAPKLSEPPPAMDKNILKLFANLKDAEKRFFDSLDSLAGDPTLASEIIGFFVPIQVQNQTGDMEGGTIPITIDLRNITQNALRLRVNTQPPEGWTAATGDSVSLDNQIDAGKEHRITYKVKPGDNYDGKRKSLSFVISGTWRNMPFRKINQISTGHNLITSWMVIGPFSNLKGDGIETVYPPDENVKAKEEYKGLNQQVKWIKKDFANGYVDFDSIMNPNDAAVGYAYVGIFTPQEKSVRLEFGCHGDAKLFMNFKEIYFKRNVSNLKPGAETIPYKLNQGWNHLVVKISERTGPFGFYFEITDLKGQTIPDLKYALDKS